MLRHLLRALFGVAVLSGIAAVGDSGAARAAVACASLPMMDQCIQCGAAKYGYDAQVRHCRENWRPGAKRREWTAADEAKSQAGSCSAGMITCAQWCTKYRPSAADCMVGHPNSCESKAKGARTLVCDRGR